MRLLWRAKSSEIEVDLTSPAMRADPYPTYARLRRERPLALAVDGFGGEVWAVSRYVDVQEALRDPRLGCNQRNATGKSDMDRWYVPKIMRAFGETMLSQDDEGHRRLRGLVHKVFTPRMIENLTRRVEDLVDELLARAASRGQFDLIADFALPLPLTIISEMMGVPDDRDRLRFHGWIAGILEGGDPSPMNVLKQLPDMVQLARFFSKLVAMHKLAPRDDLTSALIEAREKDDKLSDAELTAMLFVLLLAGHETTVNLIGNGTLALLEHPEQLALLRAQPELAPAAVEELLRFTNPVQMPSPRFAREDITLHGRTIPRGARVTALIGSANRDEEAFPRADELDLQRTPNRHVAFGHGVHYCVGAPLARLEGRIALETLVSRFPRLRLAVPREQLRWRKTTVLRGLEALPVRVD
ncbi:cytochrome P450 [Nannocystis sp. RBIL2]|uniref:cytochrome P450 family protein n=1 Tax=Nannocystis sp. RBIL2 TaxID=2996788 RepID=UPI00226DFA4F|nr:cytochrome P450 [Nannocystis sp. RBIL2]MCY1069335.1 cytochrome P450 [Nannocystis sp. RBIL2]